MWNCSLKICLTISLEAGHLRKMEPYLGSIMSRCLSIHGHIKDPFAVCSSDIAYIIIVAVFGAVARHDRIFQVLVMQVRVDALRGSGLGGSLSSLI